MIHPAPITAYIGINGSGKTLSAVAVAVREQKKWGRPFITNVMGIAVPHIYFDDVENLPGILNRLQLENGTGTCNLLIDEAGAMFASRDAGRNKAFDKTVQMLRKYDARLMWTAPAYARADKILREVTLRAVLCSPVIKVHQRGKVWPSTRVTFQRAFDVSRVDNSAQSMNQNAKGKGYGIIRTARWQDAFDSFAIAGRDLVAAKAAAAAAQEPEVDPMEGLTVVEGKRKRAPNEAA